MTEVHASAQLIASYARGEATLSADEVWALEAHLENCPVCRDQLAASVGGQVPAVAELVDEVWSDLTPLLEPAGRAPLRRRWPGRLSLSAWAPPALVPWLGMTVLVALLAVGLDALYGPVAHNDVSLVLLVAPVLPVLGVSASWVRGLDPAYELVTAMPRAGLQLVLRRTTAVLALVVPALLVAGWLTGVLVAQWLLPCLAFTTSTLALGGLIGVTRAAGVLIAAWVAVIVTPTVATSHTSFALRLDLLPVWGAIFAFGVVIVVVRKGAYGRLGIHR